MASKHIDIKIASSFSADGVLEANRGLAKLAQDVKSVNDEMRKATMRAEMAVNSYASQADKAVQAMGGGYKDLGQQLAELANEHKSVGDAAESAGEVGKKSMFSMDMAMSLARGGSEALSKSIVLLSQKFEFLKGIGVAGVGAIGAAIMGVFNLMRASKDLIKTAFNLDAAPKELREASAAMLDITNGAERFKTAMDEARDASQKQLKVFEQEADALNKITKAQLELNRAQEMSAATTEFQKSEIDAKYNSLSAGADEETAQAKRDARRNALQEERSRLIAENREAEKSITASRASFGLGVGAEDVAADAQEKIAENRKKLADNSAAIDLITKEDEAAQIAIEARKVKEENAARDLAQKKLDAEAKIAADKAKSESEAAKKAEAERIKAVEAEKKAREKMEADLHKQRVDNLKSELTTAQAKSSSLEAVKNAAQTEFDKAFGMYRSEDKGASVIADEKAYAEDLKRLKKDASRYGGKWRIDELSSLMAAGDTAGQAAKLEEWRKSSRFTPEVESMVRAVAAGNTKTTAEDELRKISENTQGLATKLDELLSMKG